MGRPEREVKIAALGRKSTYGVGGVSNVEVLGREDRVQFTQDDESLKVLVPSEDPHAYATTLKVSFSGDKGSRMNPRKEREDERLSTAQRLASVAPCAVVKFGEWRSGCAGEPSARKRSVPFHDQ